MMSKVRGPGEDYADWAAEEPKPEPDRPKRPRASLAEKPIKIDGRYYSSFEPPKLYQNPDGSQVYRGGREISKDEAYSLMFWARQQPKGVREAMAQNVQDAIKNGFIGFFVTFSRNLDGKLEIAEADKEKASTYRVLAQEMGYQIGPFQAHERSGNMTAQIQQMK